MTNPLISVIIIFYNAERFLTEAIESVISQTYDNWELLLVDDGSADAGISIAKSYMIKYPEKIFYLEHPDHQNFGKSASRNLGIKIAKGSLVTFLDADDKYLPGKLEAQQKIFEKHPDISCVMGATLLWFSWNSQNKKKDYISTFQIPSAIYQPVELLGLFLSQKAAIPAICGLMVRRNLLNEICGFEESFKEMYEDQVLYSKIAINACSYIDNNYYDLYRKHKDSSFQRSISDGTVLQYKIKYLLWLKEYLNKKNITDKSILNTLKREMWLTGHPIINYFYRRLLKQCRKLFSFRKFR